MQEGSVCQGRAALGLTRTLTSYFVLWTEHRIRHIPVVDDHKMHAMVSIGDVVRAVVDEHREEVRRLNDYIQGGY
jgi:CBS domain-containing protein